jgi:protein-tyrosine phosphatase
MMTAAYHLLERRFGNRLVQSLQNNAWSVWNNQIIEPEETVIMKRRLLFWRTAKHI